MPYLQQKPIASDYQRKEEISGVRFGDCAKKIGLTFTKSQLLHWTSGVSLGGCALSSIKAYSLIEKKKFVGYVLAIVPKKLDLHSRKANSNIRAQINSAVTLGRF